MGVEVAVLTGVHVGAIVFVLDGTAVADAVTVGLLVNVLLGVGVVVIVSGDDPRLQLIDPLHPTSSSVTDSSKSFFIIIIAIAPR